MFFLLAAMGARVELARPTASPRAHQERLPWPPLPAAALHLLLCIAAIQDQQDAAVAPTSAGLDFLLPVPFLSPLPLSCENMRKTTGAKSCSSASLRCGVGAPRRRSLPAKNASTGDRQDSPGFAKYHTVSVPPSVMLERA